MDPRLERARTWLAEHEADLIADLQTLLRYPSLEADPLPNAPFGQANRNALDYMLKLSSDAGMRTADIEGYAGYAEFGSGDKMVMSLGHLDVVPVGPGWKHEPFGAEIDNGYIYARGACDDKGPTMAMFYAARAVQAAAPDLLVRIRLVFGCNEESGFKCVHRYMETEEAPTLGVAPDAEWPCVQAEKGIANMVVSRPLPEGELTLLEINGGQRPNIVIDECVARARVAASARAEVEVKVAEKWDRNLDTSWEGDVLLLHGHGKAAHGAYPYGGDSAAIRVLRFLREIAPLSQEQAYCDLFDIGHNGGNGVGVAGSDEPSGPLTCNLGVVQTVDGVVKFTLNIRFPVTWTGEDVKNKATAHLAKLGQGYEVATFEASKPLFFPKDHILPKTLAQVYEEETGETPDPIVMGGGTYARAVPNTVAIGTGWSGDGPAHETDERIKIEHVHKMARIYAHVLVRLADAASAHQGIGPAGN